MYIMRKEQNLATWALALVDPLQIICHRELPHLVIVLPTFTALGQLRGFKEQLQIPELGRQRSQKCVVLSCVESLTENPVILVA